MLDGQYLYWFAVMEHLKVNYKTTLKIAELGKETQIVYSAILQMTNNDYVSLNVLAIIAIALECELVMLLIWKRNC